VSSEKFKIGYFADGPWSHRAFELLINDNSIQIEFIVPRSDTKDETLKNYSLEHGIKYLHPVNINSSEFREITKKFNCDLFVSMSFNQIFKKETFSIPKHQTINCHAGKLPFYRGRNILNWALINDEKEFGITVHYIDEGIDTGDIIIQRTFPITDEDNYGSLLEVAHIECASILYDAIKLIQGGTAKRQKQVDIHPVGFYCGTRGLGDEIIEWNQSTRDVFNFIRSISKPGPMAITFLGENPVKINSSRIIKGAPAYKNIPGQILAKSNDGFLVKTGDSFIEIIELESSDKIKVGMRFRNA
jgi:methionyl-tRNA formyltransferase